MQAQQSDTKIKISSTGEQLPREATEFAATLDTETGLMATVNVLDGRMTHAKALKAVAALNKATHAGFSDWRLPTVKELVGLVDYGRADPAADPEFYPDVKSSYYWSATPYASSSGFAWVVNFGYGCTYVYLHYSEARVRAVRSVSSPASQ